MELLVGADLDLSGHEPRILTVHAHPDDEASKGAGTIAAARARGAGTVLVCCTGGEAGDIINPAMERPEVRARLHEVRREELRASADAIGYQKVWMLGYRDSGMAETEDNEHPDCFARAPFDEAVARLVQLIRVERPHVVITYPDDQRGYPHPDHLRVHDISVVAFDKAADPSYGAEGAEPWAVAKLYYSVFSRERMTARHSAFEELGLESPYDERWWKRPSQDHRITTRVSIGDHLDAAWGALRAHATQIDPDSAHWFGLPDDVARATHPYDDYILARTRVGETPLPIADGGGEDDVFAGLDVPATPDPEA
ncbi:MAG: mycothiol conjugate amidase Mca [Actinomycetota bacterium]|nr:mycothiol conjugate amidase Mca [Actinomycetota bacterium]